VRKVPSVVGDATMHRVFTTLRAALNAAVKQRLIAFNPCAGVELPAGRRAEAMVWGPDEVAAFLNTTARHRMHPAWRLVLLRGLRRGELCGLQWDDIDLDSGCLTVRRARLEFGGKVTVDTPKSKTSARAVSLRAGDARLSRRPRHAGVSRKE
jgi:integrase